MWGAPATLVEQARIVPETADSANVIRAVIALAVGPQEDVYVVDSRTPAIRSYDRDGEYQRTFRPGAAGSHGFPNGVAVLSDGRVVVRDPMAASFVVYSARGDFLETWPHPDRVYSPAPILVDEEERLHTAIAYEPTDPLGERRYGLIRYAPDGTIVDTIPDPEFDYTPPALFAVAQEGDTVWFRIPLYPRPRLARSPTGDVIRGIPDRYAFDVVRADGSVLRIERDHEPVAVPREERMAHYRAVDVRARQIDYRWTWGGPVVPETKPPYKWIFADLDGRIWVQLHQPAELVPQGGESTKPDSTLRATADAQARTELPSVADFIEPVVFDVFEPDGRYLGQVSAPKGFRTRPQPVIQGNTVWAAVGERGSVPSVVRFRIER